MSDPRVTKLAQVLVKYALDLQPGQEFCLMTAPLAKELALAVYKEALLAGAHVHGDVAEAKVSGGKRKA